MKKPQEAQKQPRMQEKNTTIPRANTTSGEEARQDEHFGESTSKIQLLRWTKPGNGWTIRIRGLGPSAWWRGVSQW